MKTMILTVLILIASGAALAEDGSQKILAGQWRGMPLGAKIAYVAGAISGKRAFLAQNPDNKKPQVIMLDQALGAMNDLANDPSNSRQPLMVVADQALRLAQSQVVLSPNLAKTDRDRRFEERLVFANRRFLPVDIDDVFPMDKSGFKPSHGARWLGIPKQRKDIFLLGFGDLVVASCLGRYGDTAQGSACIRPLLPLPLDLVRAAMDQIYRDPKNTRLRTDIVIRAALRKVVGDDWQGYLNSKY